MSRPEETHRYLPAWLDLWIGLEVLVFQEEDLFPDTPEILTIETIAGLFRLPPAVLTDSISGVATIASHRTALK